MMMEMQQQQQQQQLTTTLTLAAAAAGVTLMVRASRSQRGEAGSQAGSQQHQRSQNSSR
jgi:hypothetical protein